MGKKKQRMCWLLESSEGSKNSGGSSKQKILAIVDVRHGSVRNSPWNGDSSESDPGNGAHSDKEEYREQDWAEQAACLKELEMRCMQQKLSCNKARRESVVEGGRSGVQLQ